MIKLYQSAAHPKHWIAYVQSLGWLMFPARENGWEQRQPARGLDPLHLRPLVAEHSEADGHVCSIAGEVRDTLGDVGDVGGYFRHLKPPVWSVHSDVLDAGAAGRPLRSCTRVSRLLNSSKHWGCFSCLKG